jgi:hypothetical protein
LAGEEKKSHALSKEIGNFCVLLRLCKLIFFVFFEVLQRSLQYFISVHLFSHFFLHLKGLLHIMQIFSGKSDFGIVFGTKFKQNKQ